MSLSELNLKDSGLFVFVIWRSQISDVMKPDDTTYFRSSLWLPRKACSVGGVYKWLAFHAQIVIFVCFGQQSRMAAEIIKLWFLN